MGNRLPSEGCFIPYLTNQHTSPQCIRQRLLNKQSGKLILNVNHEFWLRIASHLMNSKARTNVCNAFMVRSVFAKQNPRLSRQAVQDGFRMRCADDLELFFPTDVAKALY